MIKVSNLLSPFVQHTLAFIFGSSVEEKRAGQTENPLGNIHSIITPSLQKSL